MSPKTLPRTDWERHELPVAARARVETPGLPAGGTQGLTAATPAAAPMVEAARSVLAAAPASPRRGFWARLLARLNPARWDWAQLLTGRSRRRGSAGLVQRELFFLEQVKPMRNDLSDSDLDIVPSRRSRSEARPVEEPSPEHRGPAWRRASRRFVGTAKS